MSDEKTVEPLDILPEEAKARMRSAVTSFLDAWAPGWRDHPGVTYFVEPGRHENIEAPTWTGGFVIQPLPGTVVRIKP